MDTKKLVAGAALAGTLVVGTAGVAFAADSPTTTGSERSAPGGSTPVSGVRPAGRAGNRASAHRTRSPASCATYLKNGGTVAQWATDHARPACRP